MARANFRRGAGTLLLLRAISGIEGEGGGALLRLLITGGRTDGFITTANTSSRRSAQHFTSLRSEPVAPALRPRIIIANQQKGDKNAWEALCSKREEGKEEELLGLRNYRWTENKSQT